MERSEVPSLDHALLRRLQVRVGDLLEEDLAERRRRHQTPLSDEDTDAFKAELAHRVVDEHDGGVQTQRPVGGGGRTGMGEILQDERARGIVFELPLRL